MRSCGLIKKSSTKYAEAEVVITDKFLDHAPLFEYRTDDVHIPQNARGMPCFDSSIEFATGMTLEVMRS